MALDFSGLQALQKYGYGLNTAPANWWQDQTGVFGGGQGDWYLNGDNGYQALTQNDINSYISSTQQQMDAAQSAQRIWAQYRGAIPLEDQQNQQIMQQGTAGFTGPSEDYRLASIGNGLYGWVPKYDERFIPSPQQTDPWKQTVENQLNPHKSGGMIPIYAFLGGGLAAGAGIGGAAEGVAAGGEGFAGASAGAGAGGAAAGGAEAGGLAGGSEAGSLYGSAGSDTGGGGMWDMVDSYDPSYYDATGDTSFFQTNPDYAGNNYDPGYMYDSSGNYSTAPGTQNPSSGLDYQSLVQKYGQSVATKLIGLANGKSQGKGILDTITGDPTQAAFNSLPFLYSLYEANRQGNQVDPILARVSGLADSAANNQSGLVASAVGPYDRETMAGRDAAMADQALRGVRGSSFGDQALGNYDLTRARGRGELVGSTTAKSLGLQGDLLNSLLRGTTNAATSRNLLIGAGLSASGKLFQPQNDPFGLQNLLALAGNNNPFGS